MNKIFIFFLIFLFAASISLAFAGEVEDIRISTEFPLNESEIQEIVDNTPSTDPEMFEKVAQSQDAIAFFGEVPYKKGEDAYNWWLSLQRVAESVNDEKALSIFFEINGDRPVGYGCNIYGFMTVFINADQKGNITSDDIENIKEVFEKYTEKEGINNLPIVFVYETDFGYIASQAYDYSAPESNGILSFFKRIYLNIFDKFTSVFD